jgi:hypothetical protein
LAQRIRSQGHNAMVLQEGATYVIQLGPYPLSSVNDIVKLVKSGAPESVVKVDPVP